MNDTDNEAAAAGPAGVRADVIVPVLNEAEMLPGFLERIDALGLPLNLIFVDNGSTDGTLELLRSRPDITLIAHGGNLGYGRSLIDGMRASRAPIAIVIDADCEYPPEGIPRLLEALAVHPVVYASRFLRGGLIDMSWLRYRGNRLLTVFYNILYGQRLTDLYTGMKGMRHEAIAGLPFDRSGFEHVAELAARLSRRGIHIAEIAIDYQPRRTGRSKMRHIPELMKAIYVLAAYRAGRHD